MHETFSYSVPERHSASRSSRYGFRSLLLRVPKKRPGWSWSSIKRHPRYTGMDVSLYAWLILTCTEANTCTSWSEAYKSSSYLLEFSTTTKVKSTGIASLSLHLDPHQLRPRFSKTRIPTRRGHSSSFAAHSPDLLPTTQFVPEYQTHGSKSSRTTPLASLPNKATD